MAKGFTTSRALRKHIERRYPKLDKERNAYLCDGLTQEQLQAMYEQRITISDTETTGLAKECGLTEFASARANYNESKAVYYLETIDLHTLPLHPKHQHYLAECREAQKNHREEPRYNRSEYEYRIDPTALQVTGTRFVRDTKDRIKKMFIDQAELDDKGEPIIDPKTRQPVTKAIEIKQPLPFEEAAGLIQEFTHHFTNDLYYNAPFDKPFLKKLYEDHLIHTIQERFSPLLLEAVYTAATRESKALALNPTGQSREKNLAYIETITRFLEDPQNRKILARDNRFKEKTAEINALNAFLHYDTPPEQLTGRDEDKYPPRNLANPSLFQCLLFAYRKEAGPQPSYTLDSAHERFFPGAKKRNEHSALEDILMTARVAFQIHAHYNGTFPNFAELFEDILTKGAPDLEVEVLENRFYRKKPGEEVSAVEGDLQIQFPGPREELSERSRAYWDFLSSLETARSERNNKIPKHVLEVDEENHTITLSAERSKSLLFPLLQRLIFFEQMLDHPHQGHHPFAGLRAYDSTGTMLDLTVRPHPDHPEVTQMVEDVHFSSVRSSMKYLAAHPKQLVDNLHLIADMRKADRRVGLVKFEEIPHNDGTSHVRITVRGHMRGFGEATLDLPAGTHPAEYAKTILGDPKNHQKGKLDFLLSTGVMPYVQGTKHAHGESEWEALEERTAEEQTHPFRLEESSQQNIGMDLSSEQSDVSITVSPEIMELIKRNRDITRPLGKNPLVLYTAKGELVCHPRYCDDDTHPSTYEISGTEEAFSGIVLTHGFSASSKAIKATKSKLASAAKSTPSPSFKNTLANASWLYYRLKQIPGTFEVTLKNGVATLNQKDGVNADVLVMLDEIDMPFSADKTHIYLDADRLMEDAFHWSQALGRYHDNPIDSSQQTHCFWHQLCTHLNEGLVQTVSSDLEEKVYITNTKGSHKAPAEAFALSTNQPIHLVPKDPKKPSMGFDPIASNILGDHNYRITIRSSQEVECQCDPFMTQLIAKYLTLHDQVSRSGMRINDRHNGFTFSHDYMQEMTPLIAQAARCVYSFNYITEHSRAPITNIPFDAANNHFTLPLEQCQPFKGSTFLADMLKLSDVLNSSGVQVESAMRRITAYDRESTASPMPHANALSRRQTSRKEETNIAELLFRIAGLYKEWDTTLQEVDTILRTTGGRQSPAKASLYKSADTISYRRTVKNALNELTHFIEKSTYEASLATTEEQSSIFLQSAQAAKEVRAKLQVTHSALYRLDEQLIVLYRAIAGKHPQQREESHHKPRNMFTAGAEAMLAISDDYINMLTYDGMRLEEAIAEHSATALSFYAHAAGQYASDADAKDAIYAQLQDTYQDLAVTLLHECRENPAKKAENTAKAEALLRHAHITLARDAERPKWSDSEVAFHLALHSIGDATELDALTNTLLQQLEISDHGLSGKDAIERCQYVARAAFSSGKANSSKAKQLADEILSACVLAEIVTPEAALSEDEKEQIYAKTHKKIRLRAERHATTLYETKTHSSEEFFGRIRHVARLYRQSGLAPQDALDATWLGLNRSYMAACNILTTGLHLTQDSRDEILDDFRAAIGDNSYEPSEQIVASQRSKRAFTSGQQAMGREVVDSAQAQNHKISIDVRTKKTLWPAIDQDPKEVTQRSPENTAENFKQYMEAPLPFAQTLKQLDLSNEVKSRHQLTSYGISPKEEARKEYLARKELITATRAVLEEIDDARKQLFWAKQDANKSLVMLAGDAEQRSHTQSRDNTQQIEVSALTENRFSPEETLLTLSMGNEMLLRTQSDRIKAKLEQRNIKYSVDGDNISFSLPDDFIRTLTPFDKIHIDPTAGVRKKPSLHITKIVEDARALARINKMLGATGGEVCIKNLQFFAPQTRSEQILKDFFHSFANTPKAYRKQRHAHFISDYAEQSDGTYSLTMHVDAIDTLPSLHAFSECAYVDAIGLGDELNRITVDVSTTTTLKAFKAITTLLKENGFAFDDEMKTALKETLRSPHESTVRLELTIPNHHFHKVGASALVEAQSAEIQNFQAKALTAIRMVS